MSETTQHAEWLNLIDRTGPFLSPFVLDGAFPQGLEKVETALRKRLRDAYGEWREAIENTDSELPELHRAWIQLVLAELLEFDDEILLSGDDLPVSLSYTASEHGTTIRPDLALAANGRVRMLVSILEPDTDPNTVVRGEIWQASPVERMTLLCRATEVSLGLVTDGERWKLVFAPKDGPAEYGTWYAHYWRREPITLQAFVSLLGVRRFFGPDVGWPETLLEKSLEYQDEITETLGEQVRSAVEMLVQSLDRADIERERVLLRDVQPSELYEAGLTVMMRLVFLLCAEERGLLLLGEEAYDRHYAISTLRAQLAEDASRVGLEVLERRHDAWSRLLATFRGIYGGISHETLRLPALGGSLFDPDRFPFLEGRAVGTSWKDTPAFPLPIDNRTVLALLRALQVLEQRGGAQVLSYKALDVEQIGYVYEGLLEQTVAQVPETTLGLMGSQKAKRSDVPLSNLEQALAKSDSALIDFLVEITARSKLALTNLLIKEVDKELVGKILLACGGDGELAARVKPFGHLLRTDLWGAPLIYRKDAFAVTFGTDRRQSGSHYTPKVLTEKIVAETLEPVAYVGPAEGHPREKWRLKSPAELLDLKICDPAMGSGAFLVQVCRWLGQRLVEAWGQVEGEGKVLTVDGEVVESLNSAEPMSDNAEERLLLARRLIAERCLYGVDLNPLAVELAKLSIWLVTLAKGRPFGFLDHNLRHGDSLLGIHRLEQLIDLDMQPGKDAQGRTMLLFAKRIREKVCEASRLRGELRGIAIRDIRDVAAMARLDAETNRILEAPEQVADGLIGEALASGGNDRSLESGLVVLADRCDKYLDGDATVGQRIVERSVSCLSVDLTGGRTARRAFHWPLEFPEVFARDDAGFDAIVGNPPFMGGLRLTEQLGEVVNVYLNKFYKSSSKKADLCAYFFVRAFDLLCPSGCFGMLATNSISQGVTRKSSLDIILKNKGFIYSALKSFKWPGKASVYAAMVFVTKKEWLSTILCNNIEGERISSLLDLCEGYLGIPNKLFLNKGLGFQGVTMWGEEFFLDNELAKYYLSISDRNKKIIKKVMGGREINGNFDFSTDRFAINFIEMSLSEAEKYEEVFRYLKGEIYERRRKLDPIKYKRVVIEWWKYFHSRNSLFEGKEEKGMSRLLARARYCDTNMFAFIEDDTIYTDGLIVFLFDGYFHFALLQSSLHDIWIEKYSSSMKSHTRYGVADCFETYPLPQNTSELEVIGESFYDLRSNIMNREHMGLLTLYNSFHSSECSQDNIQELRDLHKQMDNAVATAYGWDDLELDHGFHETKQGIRFTISEEARREVLQRLLKLNHERYEEEVEQGLQQQKGTKKNTTKRKAKKAVALTARAVTKSATEPQLGLFALPRQPSTTQSSVAEQGEYWLDGVADKVLEWLEDHDGWHLKTTILQGSGVEPSQWDEAVARLLKSEGIQVRGTGDGQRYRVNM